MAPYGELVLGGWRVTTKIAGGICTAGDECHRCREECLPCWAAVLVFRILGSLCFSGSLVDLRLATGDSSAGRAEYGHSVGLWLLGKSARIVSGRPCIRDSGRRVPGWQCGWRTAGCWLQLCWRSRAVWWVVSGGATGRSAAALVL